MRPERTSPAVFISAAGDGICGNKPSPAAILRWKNGQAELTEVLSRPRLERAIGVTYRPETELYSHYFEAVLAEQFDAFVWFEETKAVTPLIHAHGKGMPETYPFGL